MTYTVLVFDRGRPIAKHGAMDADASKELVAAYRAIGWPEDKIQRLPDPPTLEERAAA